MRRYGLRDDQWDRIKDLLPGRPGSVGGTAANNPLFVEAVLFRYRAGVPWRDLPERFGKWSNVHRRFSRCAKSGVWQRVFQHLAADADKCFIVAAEATAVHVGPELRARGLLFPSQADILATEVTTASIHARMSRGRSTCASPFSNMNSA